MKLILFKEIERKYSGHKYNISEIYKIGSNKFIFYDYTSISKGRSAYIKGYGHIHPFYPFKEKNILTKISLFFETINNINESKNDILYYVGMLKKNNYSCIEFHGGENMGNYGIAGQPDGFINYGFQIELPGNVRKIEIDKCLTHKEFYLLMQIYFGLYGEERYKKKLEENESNGKYDEVKYLLVFDNWLKENPGKDYRHYNDYRKEFCRGEEAEEYFKLKLMQKDTSGAFDGLKIEKIFDKNWSEEKQREHIEEINKEYGEEIIIEE